MKLERVYGRIVPEVEAEAERLWLALAPEKQVSKRLYWPGLLETARQKLGLPETYHWSFTPWPASASSSR